MNFGIYFARCFRHLIPKSFTLGVCKLLSRNPLFWYAVIDPMYVPIRENYYECDVRPWFEKHRLENVLRTDSTFGPYAYGRWMKGEGFLRFIAVPQSFSMTRNRALRARGFCATSSAEGASARRGTQRSSAGRGCRNSGRSTGPATT